CGCNIRRAVTISICYSLCVCYIITVDGWFCVLWSGLVLFKSCGFGHNGDGG
ncbi:16387_t:CDS:1, partial [Gigaspora rosea]